MYCLHLKLPFQTSLGKYKIRTKSSVTVVKCQLIVLTKVCIRYNKISRNIIISYKYFSEFILLYTGSSKRFENQFFLSQSSLRLSTVTIKIQTLLSDTRSWSRLTCWRGALDAAAKIGLRTEKEIITNFARTNETRNP